MGFENLWVSSVWANKHLFYLLDLVVIYDALISGNKTF